MTFKNLRKHLPTTKVDYMRYTRQEYTWRIDVAGAIYTCILQDKQKYVDGDYVLGWRLIASSCARKMPPSKLKLNRKMKC